jgi:asparagine synthase (glutamine-hydrolysing)
MRPSCSLFTPNYEINTMCGIIGALSFAQSEFLITAPYITKMRDTMVHLDQDGALVWVSANGKIGLGVKPLY